MGIVSQLAERGGSPGVQKALALSMTRQRDISSGLRGAFRILAVVSTAAPLMAAAQVACDGRLFLSQDSPTGLNLISTTTNPMTFQAVGATSSITYNALGYSPADGVLYAMRTDSAGDHLFSLNQADGVAADLGAVTSLPASPVYNNGTVGTDGTYYVKPFGSTNVIYAINTGTKVATAINLTQAFTASDMARVGGAGGGAFLLFSDVG
ncbi:DUF6923 family protein [Ottowia sp. VDI28]|uniref:DUF6923 family protein n=1 Tax=Ottowia sp. VDI28 TaxID=3133968 RepID=UPI003C30A138